MRQILMVFLFFCTCKHLQIAQDSAMLKEQLTGAWEIHGTIYNNAPGDPESGGIGWFRRYDFRSDGSYVMSAYPALTVKGGWTVIKDGNDEFLILKEENSE